MCPQGISFEEFRSFFQFLNNLEDFTIAMQMYNFANRSIGQGKQKAKVSLLSFTPDIIIIIRGEKTFFFHPLINFVSLCLNTDYIFLKWYLLCIVGG